MTRLVLAIVLMLALIGSSFAQNTPNAGKKNSAQTKQSASDCKLVGTVRGTKLWAGTCVAPDELRSSVPATERNEPTAADQAAASVVPVGQK
jgi:hypothetical protein